MKHWTQQYHTRPDADCEMLQRCRGRQQAAIVLSGGVGPLIRLLAVPRGVEQQGSDHRVMALTLLRHCCEGEPGVEALAGSGAAAQLVAAVTGDASPPAQLEAARWGHTRRLPFLRKHTCAVRSSGALLQRSVIFF